MNLPTNIHVLLYWDDMARKYLKQLSLLGDGKVTYEEGVFINVPFGHIVPNENELIHKVFPS